MINSIDEFLINFTNELSEKTRGNFSCDTLLRWIKNNKIQLSLLGKSPTLYKEEDYKWVDEVRNVLENIISIMSNPKTNIKTYKDIQKAETARKVSNEDYIATTKHSNLWRLVDGRALPRELFCDNFDSEICIYENKFVVALLDKISRFVNKEIQKVNKKIQILSNYFYTQYITNDSANKFDNINTTPNIQKSHYKSTYTLLTQKDNPYAQVYDKLNFLRRTISTLRSSGFYKEIKRAGSFSESSFHPTNLLLGEHSYHACYVFNKKLNSYTKHDEVQEVSTIAMYRNYVMCCLFKELSRLGFKFTKKVKKNCKNLVELRRFYGKKDRFDVLVNINRNTINISLWLKQRNIYFKKPCALNTVRLNKITLVLMPTINSVGETVESLNESMRSVLEEVKTKSTINSFIVTSSDELTLDKVLVCSPFTNKFDSNLYNMLKSRLFLCEGDSSIYGRICPVCGSLMSGEDEKGNFVCTYCDSVYSIIEAKKSQKDVSLIWIKNLSTPSIVQYKQVEEEEVEEELINEEIIEEELIETKEKLNIVSLSFLEKLEKFPFLRPDYEQIRNELLSFGINSRISYGGDSFRLHRKLYAKITISGKHLKVYFAVKPEEYADTAIPLLPTKTVALKDEAPSSLKITSNLAVRRAILIIDDMCAKDGLVKMEIPEVVEAEPVVEEVIEPVVEEVPVAEPVVVSEEKVKTDYETISFLERLEMNPDLKPIYEELRYQLLSYGLKSRISTSSDSYRLHCKLYSKIIVAGKCLKLYLALDPNDYKDSPIPIIDVSKNKSKADVPSALRITSGLALKRAKALIDELCAKDGLVQTEVAPEDIIPVIEEESAPVIQEEPAPTTEEVCEVAQPVECIETNEVKKEYESISFEERLASNPVLKPIYEELKNQLLSYGLKNRVSTTSDSYRLHCKLYSKIIVAGKCLKLYLALDPNDYKDSPIPIIDVSKNKSKADVPSALRITSGLALKRAKALIDELCTKDGLVATEIIPEETVPEVIEEVAPVIEEVAPIEEPVKVEEVIQPVEVSEEESEMKKEYETISFEERLANNTELQEDYDELKNALLSRGLVSRISTSGDSFRLHCKLYAKIIVAGKRLKIYLALDPNAYKDSSIPVIDVSRNKSKSDVPCALKISSKLALKRALMLINDLKIED